MGGMTSRMAGRGLALAATDLPARVQQTNIKPSPTPHLGKGGRGGRGNGMQKIKGQCGGFREGKEAKGGEEEC